jgi:hypothetical protein
MEKVISGAKKILLFIWQLPQHLLALILIRVLGATKTFNPSICIDFWLYKPKNRLGEFISGVSLGRYIILKTKNVNTVKHENGHSKQSLIFGPLYLLAIGIPSAVFNNLWDRYFHKNWPTEKRHKWYYNRYPEKWADKLGGVNR